METFCSRITGAALALTAFLSPIMAHGGYFEVGASGNYRKSNIDQNAYDESGSLTGSMSYYLNEASAIELSYTDGQNKRAIGETQANGHVTRMFYKTLGMDFVYTLGPREATFRPYLKAGANYILQKRIVDQYRDNNGNLYEANIFEDEPGLVPSAGLGFRLGLTERLSLKMGVDAWTSRATNRGTVTVDYIGRTGLSVLF
jgi:outer membrane protein W